ncbi:MAG TPA: DUF4249 domain-containing protein, partial [Cyclobacteriaceae bacterium]|nr:DUF4249 domain-containing protein [Cyclobacteriaceae bacterium]
SSTPSTPTTPNTRNDINNYRGKTTPVAGQTYSIQVNVNGETSLHATNKIPFPVAITSAEVDSDELHIKFQDPVMEKNYYRIRLYTEYLYVPSTIKNGVLIPDSSKAYIVKSYLPYTSEGLADELDGNSFIADDLFNGKTYELRLKVKSTFNRPQQKLHIILLSLNKEYYDYWSSLKLAKEADDNPYLAQPVQIYSNIENGLGIFAGYSASEILLK